MERLYDGTRRASGSGVLRRNVLAEDVCTCDAIPHASTKDDFVHSHHTALRAMQSGFFQNEMMCNWRSHGRFVLTKYLYLRCDGAQLTRKSTRCTYYPHPPSRTPTRVTRTRTRRRESSHPYRGFQLVGISLPASSNALRTVLTRSAAVFPVARMMASFSGWLLWM